MITFRDRHDAGRSLAEHLLHLSGEDVVVLGLPRGGVPVAAEVAAALGAPLDAIIVRKVGVPHQHELAMGAIGEGGVRVVNAAVVAAANVTPEAFAAVEALERAEVDERSRRLRGARPPLDLTGRHAVIVDDGIATGSTARAACHVARAIGARRVVLAVPVAPADWEERLRGDADELVAAATTTRFLSVGQFYEDFAQTSEDEVIGLLARGRTPSPATPASEAPPPRDRREG